MKVTYLCCEGRKVEGGEDAGGDMRGGRRDWQWTLGRQASSAGTYI